MSQIDLNTYIYEPQSGEEIKQVVVFLHGLGANGQDLMGLAPEFAGMLPNTLFLSPDAPFPCDMAPSGFQWFSLQDRTPDVILAGIQGTSPILDGYITEILREYDLPAEKMALVGFSQGTMMSLYSAPRYKDKLAGVLGYSGALIWEQDTDIDALQKPPVRIIHGDADEVVPVSAYHQAKKDLENAGFDVSGQVCPGIGHGISSEAVDSGKEFLASVFK